MSLCMTNDHYIAFTPRGRAAVGRVAAIGFFDGVHRGHRYLIDQVKRAAAESGRAAIAVSFLNHPRGVLSPDYHPALLTTPEEKVELLRATGLDGCAMLRFDMAMARLTAREFMQDYLAARLHVGVLIMGYDHHFGADRLDFDGYVAAGRDTGIEIRCASAFSTEEFTVSSSTVRRLLEGGSIERARQCLGRDYCLSGTVVEGRHVGRDLGFPTANLRPVSPDKLVPGRGVYAVEVRLPDGSSYGGMLNIGFRPTLNDGRGVTIEVHLFGFSGNLYGQTLTLVFRHRLRDERRFASLDELKAQLLADARATQQLLQSS